MLVDITLHWDSGRPNKTGGGSEASIQDSKRLSSPGRELNTCLGVWKTGWYRTATDCPFHQTTFIGHLRTSQDVPAVEIVYSPRVPCRSKVSWDISGHPGISPLWRHCKVLESHVQDVPWDILGHPGMSNPWRLCMVPESQVQDVPWDIPGHPRISPLNVKAL